MPISNRLQKTRPHSPSGRASIAFSIHQDDTTSEDQQQLHIALPTTNERPPPGTTLTPASRGAINTKAMANGAHHEHSRDSKHQQSAPPPQQSNGLGRMASTIRTVPSLDDSKDRPSLDDDVSSEWSRSVPHSASVFSSSLNSNHSALSARSQHAPPADSGKPNVRLKPNAQTLSSQPTLAPTMEAVSSGTSNHAPSRPSIEVPSRESSLGGPARSSSGPDPSATTNGTTRMATGEDAVEGISNSATEAHLANGWDSTVGKAALGKTGRVINKLVSDNETLKREIKLEKLKADESRQAAKLAEDRINKLETEHESAMLDANITKTLLSRKERQVESLHASVDQEKKRAAESRDKEQTWREELERVRSESKKQVEEARAHAALMEGRYEAISGHWRDQGAEVHKALGRVRAEVDTLAEERAADDDKICTLRELCDQQDGNIRDLREKNLEATRKFDEYRAEQEESLREIKSKAALREAEQTRALEEAREVLDKLKWALNVKQNVRGAQ